MARLLLLKYNVQFRVLSAFRRTLYDVLTDIQQVIDVVPTSCARWDMDVSSNVSANGVVVGAARWQWKV